MVLSFPTPDEIQSASSSGVHRNLSFPISTSLSVISLSQSENCFSNGFVMEIRRIEEMQISEMFQQPEGGATPWLEVDFITLMQFLSCPVKCFKPFFPDLHEVSLK